jgi:hypothetical protein
MAGSGRRFALEAVFLAGLAVAVGLAGLSTGQIIGVMALGWLLTALIELVSWRLAVRHPTGVALPAAPAQPVDEPPGEEQEPAPEAAPVAEEPPVEQVPEPAPTRRRRFWRRRSEPAEEEHEPPPRHVRLITKPLTDTDTDSEPDAVPPPAERAEGA